MYLAQATVLGNQSGYATEIARSKDLQTWEYSDKNPVLTPSVGEGINNSDVDLFERDGKTYLYYATGDQATWVDVKMAVYDGSMTNFLASYFPAAETPEPGTMALAIIGILGIGGYVRRKQRQAAGTSFKA
jgi:beta-xylosidase